MLAEGNYKGLVKAWGFSESKSGTPRFEMSISLFEVEDETGEWAELENPVRRTIYLYLSPGAMPISVAAIRSLGFKGDDMATLDPDHEEAHSFLDVEAVVTVKHEEYNHRPTEKVELKRGYSRRAKFDELGDTNDLRARFAEANKQEQSQAAQPPKKSNKKGRA